MILQPESFHQFQHNNRFCGHYYCQDNRLKNIDHLCQVCHFHSIGMLIENIQMNCCCYSISYCTLLIKEPRVCSRLNIEPVTSFINYQTLCFLRIITFHYCFMTFNYDIHLEV